LRTHAEFNDFNRLAFIVRYAAPAARAVDALRRASRSPSVRIPRAWRANAASVFEPNAFDTRVYAAATSPAPSPELIAVGPRLFFDSRLSGTGTRSCASCHSPATAFQDGMIRPASIRPNGPPVIRNTPTLINAALQPSQFMDERSVTLEDQVLEVL